MQWSKITRIVVFKTGVVFLRKALRTTGIINGWKAFKPHDWAAPLVEFKDWLMKIDQDLYDEVTLGWSHEPILTNARAEMIKSALVVDEE